MSTRRSRGSRVGRAVGHAVINHGFRILAGADPTFDAVEMLADAADDECDDDDPDCESDDKA